MRGLIVTTLSAQVHSERRPLAWIAFHRDAAAMVADHRLHDGEPQTGSVRFGGVVGREKALALLAREALAGVGYLQSHAVREGRRAHRQRSAVPHGVDGGEKEDTPAGGTLL